MEPKMTLDEYQNWTKRTEQETPRETQITEYVFGATGELGEVVDLVKKNIFNGHQASHDRLCEELGDLFWYLARLAAKYNIKLSEVIEYNVQKLTLRYPDGYAHEKSIIRIDKTEADDGK